MQHLDEGSLQAWLDRERSDLGTAEAAAVERHLDECPECATRADELEALTRRATTLLSLSRHEDALPPYRDVVRRAGALRRSGRRRGWTASAWAASVAVALGAGWLGNEMYRSGATTLPRPREGVETPPNPRDADATAGSRFERTAEPAPGSEAAASEASEAATSPAAPAAATPESPAPRPAGSTEPARAPAPTTVSGSAVPVPATVEASRGGAAPTPMVAGDAVVAAPVRDPIVRGRVVDAQTGQPVPAVQVYIADLDVGVLTQQDGSFHLPLLEEDLQAGPLTLTVERIGYRRQDREFSAGPGDTVSMDFLVTEEALMLDEVIVTGAPSAGQRRAIGNAVAPASPAAAGTVDPALESADGWSPVELVDAAEAVGFAIVTVPDLDVTSVELGQVAGVEAVRVRQSLETGRLLTLLQARSPLTFDGTEMAAGGATSVTQRGEVWIVGIAPIPLDSLTVLLGRVR